MTARRKLVAMLSLVDPADSDEVASEFSDRLASVPGVLTLVAVRDPADPSQSLVAVGEMAQVAEPYDLSVHVTMSDEGQDPRLAAVFDIFDSISGAGLDRDRCVALSGLEHTIVEGRGGYVHLFLLGRVKGLTGSKFHRHWLRVHAEIGRRLTGIDAYRQFHISRSDSEELTRSLGFHPTEFDGLAETFYADHQAFRAIMTSGILQADSIPDQRTFIDAARSSAGLYKVVFRSQ